MQVLWIRGRRQQSRHDNSYGHSPVGYESSTPDLLDNERNRDARRPGVEMSIMRRRIGEERMGEDGIVEEVRGLAMDDRARARARGGLGEGVPLPVEIDDLDNVEGC